MLRQLPTGGKIPSEAIDASFPGCLVRDIPFRSGCDPEGMTGLAACPASNLILLLESLNDSLASSIWNNHYKNQAI